MGAAGGASVCVPWRICDAVAAAAAQGLTCAFIDAEHALDMPYARRVGVDLEKLIFAQPDDGEKALDIVDTLVRAVCLM